jgi:hypothetical protein
MTSNPKPIVQQLSCDFQNLLAYVTGSDARAWGMSGSSNGGFTGFMGWRRP